VVRISYFIFLISGNLSSNILLIFPWTGAQSRPKMFGCSLSPAIEGCPCSELTGRTFKFLEFERSASSLQCRIHTTSCSVKMLWFYSRSVPIHGRKERVPIHGRKERTILRQIWMADFLSCQGGLSRRFSVGPFLLWATSSALQP
jgi:hypothetical protein